MVEALVCHGARSPLLDDLLNVDSIGFTELRKMVGLQAVDGSLVRPGTYGRGQHGLTNAQISRQQFSIAQSDLEALTLRNLGQNRKLHFHIRVHTNMVLNFGQYGYWKHDS